MSKPLAAIVLLVISPGLAWTYPMPQGSQARASRHQAWREALDRGEQALAVGRTAEAEAAYQQVIDGSRSFDEQSLLLARALDGLGDLRRADGRWTDAEKLYVEAIELWQRFLGEGQPRLAISLHNLGIVYAELDRFDEARAALSRALAILEPALGAECEQVEETRRTLAAIERRAIAAANDP